MRDLCLFDTEILKFLLYCTNTDPHHGGSSRHRVQKKVKRGVGRKRPGNRMSDESESIMVRFLP